MSAKSGIEWTDHTFNPWWGCREVSPGCDHCYAKTVAKRTGHGSAWQGEFRTFGEKHWREPMKWNATLHPDGRRWRVFCASMCDWADNREPETLGPLRARLWELVRATPNIEWLMLTKRIGNVPRMLPPDWGDGYDNVTLMITVVNQEEADRDVPKLLNTPARRRGLSLEPLLGPINLQRYLGDNDGRPCAMGSCARRTTEDDSQGLRNQRSNGVEDCTRASLAWVICGGESGPGARPCDVAWIRDIVRQGRESGVPTFVKQLGSQPRGWCPSLMLGPPMTTPLRDDACDLYEAGVSRCAGRCVFLRDRRGSAPSEWPEDLRVREWPWRAAR